MGNGESAQKINRRSLRLNPIKDDSTWELIVGSTSTASTVLKQGITATQRILIKPVVFEINEFEAEALGANIRSGDLRLVLSAEFDYDMVTALLCDGKPVDVKKVKRGKYNGYMTKYTLYVEKRDRAV